MDVPIAAEATDERSPDAACKVLVIDDEPGIRSGCRRVLEAQGHVVHQAETAEAGLELLSQHRDAAVALVDLRMPGMGGLEFLTRARELAPEMVSVVMTAYATVETAVEATKRDAYDFITKPFAPDVLLRVVRKAVERSRLIHERNRLRAERESRLLQLATEQTRLRTIIDCMADGVMVANADDLLVLHNPAALSVLRDIETGQAFHRLGDVIRSAELFELMGEVSSKQTRVSKEIDLSDDSRARWKLVDVSPVVDERSRSFLGTVTVLRDITEIKQVEQVKAQFVNMVAHELRSPLAAVDGYLSLMEKGLLEDAEERNRIVSRCRDRVGALVELVSDLLDMARMEAGRVRREITAQSVPALCAEVAEMLRPLGEGRKVTVRAEVPPTLPTVEADKEELIRLLTNLVSNGVKYNREGGSVTLRAAEDGPYVRIEVADTGIGISEAGLERLFSEFFREKRSETNMVTGTGLGLSIVKRIVDFYHGTIGVKSALNEGSTFTVRLPRSYQAADHPA